MSDVAGDQPGDHVPHPREARNRERGPRVTVEHELRLPRGFRVAAESRVELLLVIVEPCLEDRGRGETGREQRLVDAVAGERVDETGGVADEDDRPAAGRAGAADREAATLQIR